MRTLLELLGLIVGLSGQALNENFLLSPSSQDFAEMLFEQAERFRMEITREWLGKSLPAGIAPMIRVTFADSEDEGRTWPIDSPTCSDRSVWLPTGCERALGRALAYEFACRFSEAIPLRASEDIASLKDSAVRTEGRRRVVAHYVPASLTEYTKSPPTSRPTTGLARWLR